MVAMQFKTDAMGRPTAAMAPSTNRQILALDTGVAKTLAVPVGTQVMLVNATGNVWVQYGGTVILPSVDNATGSAPELNPSARWVQGIATVSFVAPQPCLVSLSFFGE